MSACPVWHGKTQFLSVPVPDDPQVQSLTPLFFLGECMPRLMRAKPSFSLFLFQMIPKSSQWHLSSSDRTTLKLFEGCIRNMGITACTWMLRFLCMTGCLSFVRLHPSSSRRLLPWNLSGQKVPLVLCRLGWCSSLLAGLPSEELSHLQQFRNINKIMITEHFYIALFSGVHTHCALQHSPTF